MNIALVSTSTTFHGTEKKAVAHVQKLIVQMFLFRLISITNLMHNSFILQQSALIRRSVQPFTESDDTRCCDNTICPPEDEHVNARNMSRIIM